MGRQAGRARVYVSAGAEYTAYPEGRETRPTLLFSRGILSPVLLFSPSSLHTRSPESASAAVFLRKAHGTKPDLHDLEL